jgi:hypothetical protein
MRVHGVKADSLEARDLLGGHALRDQAEDLGLTLGDRGGG